MRVSNQSLIIVNLCISRRATSIVATLQVPDGKDSGLSISSVRVYITYVPHDSQLWMGKYKAHT